MSLARQRIAELGCASVDKVPKAFVDSGGFRRLETEAADTAIRRVREAAYPLILNLFGSEMPRGKEGRRVLARLGQDLVRIEKTLGYSLRPTPNDMREQNARARHYRNRHVQAYGGTP